jgi:hypothetical protein
MLPFMVEQFFAAFADYNQSARPAQRPLQLARLYTRTMRRIRKPLAIAACLSLLSLQLGGVHMHADDNGYVGSPSASFTHGHGHHDHDSSHAHAGVGHAGDHDDTKDISLLDHALGVFKMPMAILALVLLFAIVAILGRLRIVEIAYPVLSGRYTRWRPPLRAPPQTA